MFKNKDKNLYKIEIPEKSTKNCHFQKYMSSENDNFF